MSIFRNEKIRLWLLSQRWFFVGCRVKLKEGFSCYSWYWYSSHDSLVLSGIRDATLTWIVFYFLLHPLLFACFLIFWLFLIGFNFEFRPFIKTIRICFLVKCWQCSIWPGLVCQVQMWSMIENYICAWNSYFYGFDFACA